MGQELIDAAGRLRRQQFQHVAQVGVGFKLVELGRVNEAHHGRALLFAEYKLSRRSKLYAELDRTHWSGGFQGGQNKDVATGVTAGLMHSF
ncbi:hypothetical protein BO996_11960 [Delftia sp. HK171]|nr:hypothetical protein BO996_11960 [Delftia sp. HK171]